MPLCDHPYHEKGEAMISREQLQSIEWAIKDEDGGSWCPACASPADIGHKCDCWLARALAAPPADGSETGWVIERDNRCIGVKSSAPEGAQPERGTLEHIMWLAQRGQIEQARAEFSAAVTHKLASPAVAQARDKMVEQLDQSGFFRPQPPAVAGGDAAPETPASFRGSCEGCPYPDTCSWFRRCTFRRRRQEGQ